MVGLTRRALSYCGSGRQRVHRIVAGLFQVYNGGDRTVELT